MTRAGTVTELAGIGKTIAEKLVVLFETGEIPAAQKLKATPFTGSHVSW